MHGCDGGPESSLHAATLSVHPPLRPAVHTKPILLWARTRLSGSMGWYPSVRFNRSFLIHVLHLSYHFPCFFISIHTLSPRSSSFVFWSLHPVSRGFHRILFISCIITSSNSIQSFLSACEFNCINTIIQHILRQEHSLTTTPDLQSTICIIEIPVHLPPTTTIAQATSRRACSTHFFLCKLLYQHTRSFSSLR